MPIINQVVKGSGGGSAPQYYIDKVKDANDALVIGSHLIDFTGIKTIGTNALHHAYFYNTSVTGSLDMSDIERIENTGMTYCFRSSNLNGNVDLRSLTYVGTYGLQYAFAGTRITSVNLSGLIDTTLCGNGAFADCFVGLTTLASVNLDNLEKASLQNMFKGCRIVSIMLPKLYFVSSSGLQSFLEGNTSLTTASMPSLIGSGLNRILTSCFLDCNLTTFKFESLKNMQGASALSQTFKNNLNLQSIWFYALNTSSFGSYTNQFSAMLSGCTNVTIHFPMAIQSTIGSWSDVTNGFAGTNTTVLFDIVTTLTGADGNTYTRQEKDSTATATAWVYNDTLYYTSGVSDNDHGVNEPAVSDAIYSDAACTQSITTITAIA